MSITDIKLIVEFAVKVNGVGERRQEATGNKPTVFLNYWGHTAKIEVKIHESGWVRQAGHDKIFIFDTDKPLDAELFSDYIAYMTKLSVATEKRMEGNI